MVGNACSETGVSGAGGARVRGWRDASADWSEGTAGEDGWGDVCGGIYPRSDRRWARSMTIRQRLCATCGKIYDVNRYPVVCPHAYPWQMEPGDTGGQMMIGRIVCQACGRQLTIREALAWGSVCGKCKRATAE